MCLIENFKMFFGRLPCADDHSEFKVVSKCSLTGAVPAEEVSGGHGTGDKGERRGSRGFIPSKFF